MRSNITARETHVIAPNFKRRLSGVTSTIVQLLPFQARRIAIASMGPDVLPKSVPRLSWGSLPALWRRPKGKSVRIWHARRNTEMLPGIVMRDVLRMPLKLVFTSAAQREHSAYTRFLIRRMDRVIATSSKSGSFLKVPHRVVMHGIDCDRFVPDGPLPQLSSDLEYRLAGKKIVGCSGRIRHQKGTDLFIDAMIEVLKDRPDWAAVATGRTTSEHAAFGRELQNRVAAAGMADRILFAGEVDDIAPWFRRFDIYVAPPRNEGFGLTPLEAMASGTPVIATDAGAFRELIVEGQTGTVVDSFSSEAIAAALVPYMDDDAKREAASRGALAHVREHFPLQREAAEIESVYDELWSETNSARSMRGLRNS
ncbi:glycosyltransferase family 4 protein [Fulvimarina sp. MAC3]|uniref:glycosyltransferase family 4 protein n=1 Tax=Fulvimarina sp. MAC3 TaxID=3148887 RepID=UPI0031FBAA42